MRTTGYDLHILAALEAWADPPSPEGVHVGDVLGRGGAGGPGDDLSVAQAAVDQVRARVSDQHHRGWPTRAGGDGLKLAVGSLFSGIGGLDLGLERAGMRVLWQCERDDRCRRVLQRHWPDVPCYGDIRSLRSVPDADVVCGGFPCQDVSDASAGRGGGIHGGRSGLWGEMIRIVELIRPTWVIVENTDGAAWKRWVPVVRLALHRIDYPSVPIRVRACDVGAPHKGCRIFVVAKTHGEGESASAVNAEVARLPKLARPVREDWGLPPSDALGVADGVPDRMERLVGIGNAVVPAAAAFVGRLVIASR